MGGPCKVFEQFLVRYFAVFQWRCLGREVFVVARLAVVVGPTVYGRDFSGPVAVDVLDRCRPLQSIGLPWVLRSLGSAPHGVEEVEDEDQLRDTTQDGEHRDDDVDVLQFVEDGEFGVAVVATWKARQSGEVHGEEYTIGRNEGQPEVPVAQGLVHHSAVHFGEPVVHPCEHAEDGRKTHNDVEVCHNEVGIVYVDVQGRVAQDDAGQTTCHEGAHQAYGEQHRRSELQIALPQGGNVVEGFHRRRDSNQQGREGEYGAQEGVHTGYEHVVAPNDEGQEGNRKDRSNHRTVAEDGLTRIGSDNLRGDTQCGQQDDVYLRVAEEPEQVFVEDGATAFVVEHLASHHDVGEVEARAEHSVKHQEQSGAQQYGEGQNAQNGSHQEGPNGQGQARHGHAFGAQVDDGHDVVQGSQQRTGNEEGHRNQPKGHTRS